MQIWNLIVIVAAIFFIPYSIYRIVKAGKKKTLAVMVLSVVNLLVWIGLGYWNLSNQLEWMEPTGIYSVDRCYEPNSAEDILLISISPVALNETDSKPEDFLHIDFNDITAELVYACEPGSCLKLKRSFWGTEEITVLPECPEKTYEPYKFQWPE